MLFTVYSLSDTQGAAHIKLTLDIVINFQWIDSFLKAIMSINWEILSKILWQVSKSDNRVSEVSWRHISYD